MPQSLLEERPTVSMMLSALPEMRSLDALIYDAVLSSGGAPPSLISLVVSVDVKHHVYLLT